MLDMAGQPHKRFLMVSPIWSVNMLGNCLRASPRYRSAIESSDQRATYRLIRISSARRRARKGSTASAVLDRVGSV
jgi:hypothetical protein